MILSRRECIALGGAGVMSALAGPVVGAETVLSLRNSRIQGANGQIDFSREELSQLEQLSITTGNDFIDNVADFRGPSAHAVVDMIAHAGSSRVRMIAKNEYFVEIDIAELHKYGAILALEMDGKPLSRRNKGPIWLMYPLDSYPELQDSVYNSRLIWQLRTIELF